MPGCNVRNGEIVCNTKTAVSRLARTSYEQCFPMRRNIKSGDNIQGDAFGDYFFSSGAATLDWNAREEESRVPLERRCIGKRRQVLHGLSKSQQRNEWRSNTTENEKPFSQGRFRSSISCIAGESERAGGVSACLFICFPKISHLCRSAMLNHICRFDRGRASQTQGATT